MTGAVINGEFAELVAGERIWLECIVTLPETPNMCNQRTEMRAMYLNVARLPPY